MIKNSPKYKNMDYRFEQKTPIVAADASGKPVVIQDARLPFLQQILQNQDYEQKIETIVTSVDNLSTVTSGQNQVLKFVLNTEQKALISLPETYIEFEVEVGKAGDPTATLTKDTIDTYSQIATVNPDWTKTNNKVIAVNGTTVSYVYVPNSNAFFSRFEIKALNTQATLDYVDEPALLTKVQMAAAGNSFWEKDGNEACDKLLANVHTFMPDWPLHGDVANRASTVGFTLPTPRGIAPFEYTSGSTIGRCTVDKDNTIPFYDLNNIEYASKKIPDIAAANLSVVPTNANAVEFKEAAADGDLETVIVTGANAGRLKFTPAGMTKLATALKTQLGATALTNTSETEVKMPTTIPFPEVRSQLHNMTTQSCYAYLGCLDYFNSMVLHSGSFGPMELDLTVNTYGRAFTDMLATFTKAGANAGEKLKVEGSWTQTSNFDQFKLKNIKLHIMKYILKADTVRKLGESLLSTGLSIPYSSFRRNPVSWNNSQSDISIEFRDSKVRSLDKIIIIPRLALNDQDSAIANKYVFSPTCTPDCDGTPERDWNGVSEIELTYLNNKWPVRPIEMKPYHFDQVKEYALRCYESPISSMQAYLPRWCYEGIGPFTPVSNIKVQYAAGSGADEVKDPGADHLAIVSNWDLKPYAKEFCAPAASDFAIMLDLRTMNGATNAGLDLVKGSVTVNLKRKTNGSSVPNLKLDVYYVISSFMHITDQIMEVTY